MGGGEEKGKLAWGVLARGRLNEANYATPRTIPGSILYLVPSNLRGLSGASFVNVKYAGASTSPCEFLRPPSPQ